MHKKIFKKLPIISFDSTATRVAMRESGCACENEGLNITKL